MIRAKFPHYSEVSLAHANENQREKRTGLHRLYGAKTRHDISQVGQETTRIWYLTEAEVIADGLCEADLWTPRGLYTSK